MKKSQELLTPADCCDLIATKKHTGRVTKRAPLGPPAGGWTSHLGDLVPPKSWLLGKLQKWTPNKKNTRFVPLLPLNDIAKTCLDPCRVAQIQDPKQLGIMGSCYTVKEPEVEQAVVYPFIPRRRGMERRSRLTMVEE